MSYKYWFYVYNHILIIIYNRIINIQFIFNAVKLFHFSLTLIQINIIFLGIYIYKNK